MSEAFINAISECHKDEVIKWLQQIYSENEQLRHDITRHVQICAEQANEIADLRKALRVAREALEFYAGMPNGGGARMTIEKIKELMGEK